MSSRHVPGTGVVDVWERKRRRGLPTCNQGKRWLARAQIRQGIGRYRTKAFHEEQDAWTWAEETVARYRLGLDNGRRCTIRALMDEYVEHLAGKGASQSHVVQARWNLQRLVDAGINDLRDERLAAKVEGFYRHLPSSRTTGTDRCGGARSWRSARGRRTATCRTSSRSAPTPPGGGTSPTTRSPVSSSASRSRARSQALLPEVA